MKQLLKHVLKYALVLTMYIVLVFSFLGFWLFDDNQKPYISPTDIFIIQLKGDTP